MLAENKARQTARLGGKLSPLGIGEMEKIQYYYTENGRLLTTFGVKFRSFLSGWRWRSRGESERVPRACAREIRVCIVVGVRVLREHGRVSAAHAEHPRQPVRIPLFFDGRGAGGRLAVIQQSLGPGRSPVHRGFLFFDLILDCTSLKGAGHA